MSLTQQNDVQCDLLVAGGGPAGVPAAIAAARCGARVILCQDRPVLGGNASSEVRMHIVGADQHGARGKGGELAAETREGGIIEEIRLETAVRNPQRCAQMLDLVLYEMVRAEKNLTLLLNTAVTGAAVKDGRITHALAQRPGTEEAFRIAAKVFIDCTGDGRLGAETGAAFRHGREAASQYDEKYAPQAADGKTLGSSLLFTARDFGRDMPFVAPPWARKFSEADFRLRPIHGFEYGYWWVEWGGQLDTIRDNERIRDELLAVLMGVWDYIKNSGKHPQARTWALDWFGWVPGKRESRRFIGQYVLRESDLLTSRHFDDAIAYGGWKIDLHPPEGVDRPDLPPFTPIDVPHLYDIPLRSCVARDVDNLMFAGRNISATHVAFASTRVMATCAAMGQGVGTAAAHAVKTGVCPGALAGDATAMRAIQQRLLREDAYLIGVLNDDPADVARRARVCASSQQADGPAVNILTGQTRSVHSPRAAPPDRARPGTHRWMSEASAGLPAWIELRWDRPVRPACVQLIFDTGMHRELTLSQSDAANKHQLWGRPQPETVRDYTIDGLVNGHWRTLAAVTGNYQRRRVHAIAHPPAVTALRVNVTATNGLDHARVFEVRVYE